MDPQLDERLRAIEKQLTEMNTSVSKLRHAQVAARNRKYVYWGIIIVISIISLYSIKPYLAQLKEAYGVGNTNSGANSNYGDLLKTLNQ